MTDNKEPFFYQKRTRENKNFFPEAEYDPKLQGLIDLYKDLEGASAEVYRIELFYYVENKIYKPLKESEKQADKSGYCIGVYNENIGDEEKESEVEGAEKNNTENI